MDIAELEIKSHFSDWHKASKEQARKYAKYILENATNVPRGKRAEYILKHKLRGAGADELLL